MLVPPLVAVSDGYFRRPVDLLDGYMKRELSVRLGESSLPAVIGYRTKITSGAKAATERE